MNVKLDLKNKIINGAFDYWQRNTSFAAIANNAYHADRFHYAKAGAMVHTIARSTDVPASSSSVYSLLATTTTIDAAIASTDFVCVLQHIEGNVLRSFKNKKMVMTFWVKAFKTGTYCVSIRNANASRSLVLEYTVNASNTWEKKTLRFTHDSTGTWAYDTSIGLTACFVIASGSSFNTTAGSWQNGQFFATANQVNGVDSLSNSFQLTDICMVEDNEGQTRVPDFMYAGRDVFEELQLCQRYYETSLGTGGQPSFYNGQTSKIWWVPYSQRKRVDPVLSVFNQPSGSVAVGGYQSGTDGFGAFLTGTTSGNANYIDFSADAEL